MALRPQRLRALLAACLALASCGAAGASGVTDTDATNNRAYTQAYPKPVMADPPQVPASKVVKDFTNVPAGVSTQIAPANSVRLALEIQCDGTAPVQVDETGSTLTSATQGGTFVIPQGSYPVYTPPVTTTSAITAYTGTAQACRVTEYNR